MVKILGISCSPRKNGNTASLVQLALDEIKSDCETEYISLAGKKIGFCIACDKCKDQPKCPIEDDVENILNSMKQADGIILGSPVYFGNMSAQAKALIDRTLVLRRHGMQLRNKVFGFISVGGSRNGGQEIVLQSLHAALLIHEAIIVSDRETAHFGGIAVGRNPGEAVKDEIGVKTVRNIAIKVLEIAKKISS
ncbi:MAG: flavodoxin family protein [Candidatus Helarchaeales archaeon]